MPLASPNPATDVPLTDRGRRDWLLVGWLAGGFTAVVAGVMIFGQLRASANDPLKSPPLEAAKKELRVNPTDEALKQRIRDLDLQVRRQYFRHQTLNHSGAYLLLAGAILVCLAARRVRAGHEPLPRPALNHDAAEQAMRASARIRRTVAALGVAIGASFLVLALGAKTALPTRAGESAGHPSPDAPTAGQAMDPGPPLAEIQVNWPRFRGPEGNGVAGVTNPPLAWNATTGAGVIWKSAVPLPGPNSPVVWGERIFLAGADAQSREVYCFNGATGDLRWRRAVQPSLAAPAPLPKVSELGGFAASTAATDGRRVFAIFATGELVALDLDGNPVWTKNLGVPDNPYGFATSLVVWQGRLLLQLDQGQGSNSTKSKLYAFEAATGRVIWERNRSAPSSWATPIVIEAAGRHQLITLGEPWLIAYDAADGNELWRANCLGADLAPSPVFAAGLVVFASPWKQLAALRPDGRGDVTKTHLAWTIEENVPDITSPVANGELLFTVGSQGLLTCYDVKDGKRLWDHDLDMECHASPSLAASRLYVVGSKGTTVVVAADRQFKELGRAELGEAIYASPAFVGERIYLRGAQHLFCVGARTALSAGAGMNLRNAATRWSSGKPSRAELPLRQPWERTRVEAGGNGRGVAGQCGPTALVVPMPGRSQMGALHQSGSSGRESARSFARSDRSRLTSAAAGVSGTQGPDANRASHLVMLHDLALTLTPWEREQLARFLEHSDVCFAIAAWGGATPADLTGPRDGGRFSLSHSMGEGRAEGLSGVVVPFHVQKRHPKIHDQPGEADPPAQPCRPG
ncbi:MAG: PQQ-binding-like beta-propeller repeat protein [Verrucomicrobia bacterium]|nr:PQQ-binding-like beta-propeller repeat protein [Verrucomicrobiota bacterium]